MDTSPLLVQAASGLQRNLSGAKGTVLKDSTVAQISAAIYYQATTIAKVTTNKGFQEKFRTILFKQIEKDFSEYIDAQARSNPKSLHHMYEWKRVGQSNSRLFKLVVNSAEGLSFSIKADFLLSKSMVPSSIGKSRYVFANKASVMEAGNPIVIRPRNAKRLVFKIDDDIVFMPEGRSVTVRKPGGGKASGRFQIAYARFFTGNLVSLSIKRSGFQQIFSSNLGKALKLPFDVKKVKYSFSANSLNVQSDTALKMAFGG